LANNASACLFADVTMLSLT